MSAATAVSLTPAATAVAGIALLIAGVRTVGIALILVYAAALVASGLHAAVRFRSLVVGILEPPAVVASQVAYLLGFFRGFMD